MAKLTHPANLVVDGKVVARNVSFMAAARALSTMFPDATREDGKPLMTGIDRKRIQFYNREKLITFKITGHFAVIAPACELCGPGFGDLDALISAVPDFEAYECDASIAQVLTYAMAVALSGNNGLYFYKEVFLDYYRDLGREPTFEKLLDAAMRYVYNWKDGRIQYNERVDYFDRLTLSARYAA